MDEAFQPPDPTGGDTEPAPGTSSPLPGGGDPAARTSTPAGPASVAPEPPWQGEPAPAPETWWYGPTAEAGAPAEGSDTWQRWGTWQAASPVQWGDEAAGRLAPEGTWPASAGHESAVHPSADPPAPAGGTPVEPAGDSEAVWDVPPSWGPPPVWGVAEANPPALGGDAGGAGGSGLPPVPPGPGNPGAAPVAPNRLRRAVLVGLGVVLVLGAVAGGILIGRSSNQQHTTTASETIPSPGNSSSPGTTAKIDVAGIAQRVDPAVVDLTSVLGASATGDRSAGTGMILTPNGEVLTNNHVIADGTSITAQINGTGRVYKVLVLGTDVTADVALVQLVGASNLPTVSIGNSSKLQLGDPVVAIGNALDLKGPETVTQGIVSALGRSITASDAGTGASENLSGLIQTDAPINPGNSGGPLLNADGQVVGMDTAAATGSATQSATDIGFAIPINTAIGIAQQIQQGRSSKSITIDNKGFLGVQVISISEAEDAGNGFFGQVPSPGTSSGAYVAGVLQGTPAVQADLQIGDVITSVNGEAVANPQDLGTILTAERPGDSVVVTWVTPERVHRSATIILVSHPVA